MKKIPRTTYQSSDELEVRIKEREADAALLPPGATRQSVLKEVAQLRMYASVKRWADAEPMPLQHK
ncbi:hypothetical protein [Bradyrhizobium sp. LHD-71]|uniref:hypothetical protein n=1 Tax=Bradyrhizobium sp. LHD-71 TaxID=3072141 RepID=UPI00280E713B|nr:hypothetical protein [Bradyrhizobium sp. LHD-71]MDQ8729488.1 hypothetical protein [Bradyrhizobium sp. LHD-71]